MLHRHFTLEYRALATKWGQPVDLDNSDTSSLCSDVVGAPIEDLPSATFSSQEFLERIKRRSQPYVRMEPKSKPKDSFSNISSHGTVVSESGMWPHLVSGVGLKNVEVTRSKKNQDGMDINILVNIDVKLAEDDPKTTRTDRTISDCEVIDDVPVKENLKSSLRVNPLPDYLTMDRMKIGKENFISRLKRRIYAKKSTGVQYYYY